MNQHLLFACRRACWLFLFPLWAAAQPAVTPFAERMTGFQQKQTLLTESWFRDIRFDNVGPRVFSGRVSDICVNSTDPTEFLVAYASGGLWRTSNNGASFEPLFDREASLTIGAIAADWERGTVWVGTGEVNASRSSYAGTGIYVSRDTGRTWTWTGLPESHHIGRIVLHPNNPDVVWVAVMGHLYSENPERGVYRTTDGGKNWRLVLAKDARTGAIGLIADPQNPDILYAAMWERQRQAWNLEEAGPGSGIYRSKDGGDQWEYLSGSSTGFPEGPGCGRIGLTSGVKDGQTVVFAVVDNQAPRPQKDLPTRPEGIHKEDLRTLDTASFFRLKEEDLEKYLRDNGFPEKYSSAAVIQLVKSGQIQPVDLVHYLEDANAALFDVPVVGAEVYRWVENNMHWERTHPGYLDDVFYSYGYYFGQIRTPLHDPSVVYVLGVPILRSSDGGRTFTSVNAGNVHVDHHALWINPFNARHLLLGNDGGLNLSYDAGEHWTRLNRLAVGQFYSVAVDMEEPFRIYGGLQDNGVWQGPSTYKADTHWEMNGRYPYVNLLGGDGMQVQIDPRSEQKTIYTGYQFGHYFRLDGDEMKRTYLTPKPDLGHRPYRWNWQTPIHLSLHQPDILYMGAERVLRSLDRGAHFKSISGDLTAGGRKGDVPYGTLTTLHESPLRFGLLYTGSDDGLVHVSLDGGHSWQRITDGLPEGLWVSRIQASHHLESRVWVSLNGYRQDHFDAWIYRSDDFGQSWTRMGINLPAEPVNVIKEDPRHPGLIYAGTDHGVYASLDTGKTFMPLDNGLPHVAVHDLVVHPREGQLILGTHGRSLYKADVRRIQLLTDSVRQLAGYLFAPEDPVQLVKRSPSNQWAKSEVPQVAFWLFSPSSGHGRWAVRPKDHDEILAEGDLAWHSGLNVWTWDMELRPPPPGTTVKTRKRKNKSVSKPWTWPQPADGHYYLPPGEYVVRVQFADGTKYEQPFTAKR